MIDAQLTKLSLKSHDLNAVSVSSGPGSYTGLRIGVSTAKGICYSLNIPLIAVGSLHVAAFGMLQISNAMNSDFLIPLIDARRMEVFGAVYDSSLSVIQSSHPWIMDTESLEEFKEHRLFLAGSGSEKLKTMYASCENVFFLDDQVHRAANACKLAYEKFLKSDFENTAYFEPDYGKEFLPGKPVVKGLK